MLAFRNGVWRAIPIVLMDPLFSEEHRLQLAACAATSIEKGISLQASVAEAEKILYERIFPGLISRK